MGLQIMQGLPRVAGGVKEVQGMQVAFMVQGSIREFFYPVIINLRPAEGWSLEGADFSPHACNAGMQPL